MRNKPPATKSKLEDTKFSSLCDGPPPVVLPLPGQNLPRSRGGKMPLTPITSGKVVNNLNTTDQRGESGSGSNAAQNALSWASTNNLLDLVAPPALGGNSGNFPSGEGTTRSTRLFNAMTPRTHAYLPSHRPIQFPGSSISHSDSIMGTMYIPRAALSPPRKNAAQKE